MYNSILNRCKDSNNGKTPLLIIGNKINNLKTYEADFVFENLDLQKLDECNIKAKYFEINVKKDKDKIMKALRWIARNML